MASRWYWGSRSLANGGKRRRVSYRRVKPHPCKQDVGDGSFSSDKNLTASRTIGRQADFPATHERGRGGHWQGYDFALLLVPARSLTRYTTIILNGMHCSGPALLVTAHLYPCTACTSSSAPCGTAAASGDGGSARCSYTGALTQSTGDGSCGWGDRRYNKGTARASKIARSPDHLLRPPTLQVTVLTLR